MEDMGCKSMDSKNVSFSSFFHLLAPRQNQSGYNEKENYIFN